MGKFIGGIIIGVLALAGGVYAYLHYGLFDMRADRPNGRLEMAYMNDAMDRYAGRHAPKVRNPLPLTDATLIGGIAVYKSNCAGCHGGPDMPESALGAGFNPPAPQFVKDAPDMPENQNYWIIRHGVKMTGMPAWEKVLAESDIWKVTTFVGRMGELDKLSPAVQQAWKGSPAVAAPPASAEPAPGSEAAPRPAPTPEQRRGH